jgi:hypothetical protein
MFHIKLPDETQKSVDEEFILHELYYNLGILDSSKYTENNFLHAKIELSRIDKLIPLFDIFSKNLYLIEASNVYSRVIFYHYRLPNKNIIKILTNTLNKISKSNKLSNSSYTEKLKKNLNFISNYDLDTLSQTYYKVFYLYQPMTSDLTTCIKPSFIPFITSKPYYTKSELVNLGLNMEIKIDLKTIDSDSICQLISINEITSKEILEHQIYIKENIAKAYIQLYSLLGSYYWNYYIRNECFKDLFVEKQIDNLHSIISKAPEFDKDYWLYRFISSDNYLSHLIPGDIYEEKSFISTTRNPFYDPKNNLFGFILIKIKIPKHVEGIGLCIESYSLFQSEEEVLLNPGVLKLISIKENYHYYHPNPNASKRIKKLYTFDYIKAIKSPPSSVAVKYKMNLEPIPKINWLDAHSAEGDDFISKVYYFYRIVLPVYNNKRYFYSDIGSQTYLFQAFYLDDNPVYEKYFFLQNKSKVGSKDEIYFVLQNENTGEIVLFIELRDTISVNYISRFLGSKNIFNDDDFIKFISSMAHYFSIDSVIIHNTYSSYDKISSNLLKIYDDNIIDDSNPDNHTISLFSGDFKYWNVDFINFIENKTPRYKLIPGVEFNLKKHHIQFMDMINAKDIFTSTEKTPLFSILNKLEKTPLKEEFNCSSNQNSPKVTCKSKSKIKLTDFYLYIHYNFFYLLDELNHLIAFYNNDIFITSDSNPWLNSYFILNSEEYLYNKSIIPLIQTFKTNIFQDYIEKLAIENKHITFNKYRLGLI